MPRRARTIVGGYAYHVLNRANGRLRLFRKQADFAAFEEVLRQAHQRVPLRILSYVVMSNHWHFVVWPKRGRSDEVTEFFRWLTHTHSQRWHAHHGTAGMGHVYQGRFKSFPIATDEHLATVMRYVERNPLRAKLVARAEDWQWGSLHRRVAGEPPGEAILSDPPLTEPPIALGRLWTAHVNKPQHASEVAAIGECIARSRPYGGELWSQKVAKQLGLEHSFRSRGRPKNDPRPL